MGTRNEEIWQNFKSFAGDVGRDAMQAYINDEINRALIIAKTYEIARATAALYAAKLEDKIIIQLLQDHWKMTEAEASEALRIEITVKSPMNVLKAYLQSEGYNIREIIEFMKKNHVKQQLENNSSLCKLSKTPAKLIEKIEAYNQKTV